MYYVFISSMQLNPSLRVYFLRDKIMLKCAKTCDCMIEVLIVVQGEKPDDMAFH